MVFLRSQVHTYKRLTPFSILDHALESLDNLSPGDCIVCFSKNDIYSLSRQIEAKGLECAVIYGSLPPGECACGFYRTLQEFVKWLDILKMFIHNLMRKPKKLSTQCFILCWAAVERWQFNVWGRTVCFIDGSELFLVWK